MISARYSDTAGMTAIAVLDGVEWSVRIDAEGEISRKVREWIAAGGIPDPYVEPPSSAPTSITRRQLLIQLKSTGLISGAEAVAAAQTGAVPAAVQAVFNTLPTQDEKDSAAITWAAMSVAERDNQLVAFLAASRGMTSAQVDDFFRSAAAL